MRTTWNASLQANTLSYSAGQSLPESLTSAVQALIRLVLLAARAGATPLLVPPCRKLEFFRLAPGGPPCPPTSIWSHLHEGRPRPCIAVLVPTTLITVGEER